MGIFSTISWLHTASLVTSFDTKVKAIQGTKKAYDNTGRFFDKTKSKASKSCESAKTFLSEKQEDFIQKVKDKPGNAPILHSRIHCTEKHTNPFSRTNIESLGVDIPETERPKKRLFC